MSLVGRVLDSEGVTERVGCKTDGCLREDVHVVSL